MNTFGHLFRVTTFGESHGPAIGCVIDGCPPGIALAPEDFVHDLARRATGKTRHTSARREADQVEILSGVYEGVTTGTPIALLVRNTDQRSKDYNAIARQFRRPCDYAYWRTASATARRPWLGARDHDAGGRGGGREVVGPARRDRARLPGPDRRRGAAFATGTRSKATRSSGPAPNRVPARGLHGRAAQVRRLGGREGGGVADGVPPGWGEPVYGKLDGELARR